MCYLGGQHLQTNGPHAENVRFEAANCVNEE